MSEGVAVKEIVLRELEPILRKTIADSLTVVNYTTKALLPPGENYGSTILSVEAVIKKTKDAKEEVLHLIAKMSPPTEFQKKVFDSPYTFRKEIFMYEDILPSYNRLEIECGINKDEVFDVLPKFYGSRLSLKPDVELDDDAVILLENLKVKGYYTQDRSTGCDYEHSKVAIRAMARFHALGIATKYKKPEYFEVLKVRSKCFQIQSQEFDGMEKALLKKMQEDPVITKYYEKCEKVISSQQAETFWYHVPDEPWSTVIHADFWVNNILFHKDEQGRVDDVKFVDFQNYLFFSPLREMIFYLFSSVDDDTHNNHIEDLIDLYHETFVGVLAKLGCDVEPFTREKFDAQIPIDANLEFFHLTFMLKVLTLDVKEANFTINKIDNIMVGYEGNKLYNDRLRRLVVYFAEHNWI